MLATSSHLLGRVSCCVDSWDDVASNRRRLDRGWVAEAVIADEREEGIGWMKNESHHSMVRQIVIAKGEAEHNVALTPFCPSRGHEFHDGCTTFHRNVPTHPAQRPWHHEGWRDTGWTGEALPRHATSAIDTIASVQPASVTDGDASLILRCWPTAPRCRAVQPPDITTARYTVMQ